MFEVRLDKQPVKYFKKLSPKLQKAFFKCFVKLEERPFLLLEPLYGQLKEKWKVVIGGFRLICDVDIDKKTVKIIFIKPRGDIYK
ncbi:MAG: type II toxin-antitoxin system RelE/ParE family toxin [Armatimonadota bacterium]